jgi:hypothetical protein
MIVDSLKHINFDDLDDKQREALRKMRELREVINTVDANRAKLR